MSTLIVAATAGHPGTDLVVELSVILCVAAITTVLFQRLRQPVVLGYLLAGLIVGPHLPVPLFADQRVAHTLSELGVILLMFSLGLEFSLRKLIRVGPTAGLVGIIQCGLLMWLGTIVARAFGWTSTEALFTGAMIAISSTTIIVKAFADHKVSGPIAELVFGILIVEDLIAVLLLAVLTAVATGAGLSAGALAVTVGKLAGFLVGTLAFGMLLVPRMVRAVVRLGRHETTIVACVGLCFGCALLARAFGYSVALGAFLGGALVAESGATKEIEPLVAPVRDVFAAIFFVSVGMLIDPRLVAAHGGAVVSITLIVIVGKLIGVALGAFLAGSGVATSIRAGLSLAQIGEFSFIIAALGLQLGAIRDFLYPVAVAVSAITTLTTPWLIQAAAPIATWVDRRLPRALQTYVALYGAWVARLGAARAKSTTRRQLRRLVALLFVDVAGIAVVVIGGALGMPVVARLAERLHWAPSPKLARLVLVATAGVVAIPFVLGAVRLARSLAARLAVEALPSSGAVDLSAAPRRALVVTLQLAILLAFGLPLVAVTQPFLPSVPGFAVLLVLVAVLVVPLWQSATRLEQHVRAGAEVVLERLAAESRDADREAEEQSVERLLAGLGAAKPVLLTDDAPAIGRSLKQIALRGRTSATVVAIRRASGAVVFPTGDERLAAGDVLVLTGTEDAVRGATAVLLERA